MPSAQTPWPLQFGLEQSTAGKKPQKRYTTGRVDDATTTGIVYSVFTFRTESPLEAERANALAVRTVPVAIAVGHLALVVSQVALFAFPPGVALALAVDVLAALAAQHRTDACGGGRNKLIFRLDWKNVVGAFRAAVRRRLHACKRRRKTKKKDTRHDA